MLAGTIDRGDQCNQSTLTRQFDTRLHEVTKQTLEREKKETDLARVKELMAVIVRITDCNRITQIPSIIIIILAFMDEE